MPEKSVEQILSQKKIGEIINPRLIQAPPTITVKDAVELMRVNKSGYIVIAEKKKVVGMFTETDVVRRILEKPVDWNKPVREFMTQNPFILSPEDNVLKAIDLMGEHKFYHIPLIDKNGELVNVLSVRTLIRFLAEFYPTEIYNLPPNPTQVMKSQEGG